jgi:hypothetical protein
MSLPSFQYPLPANLTTLFALFLLFECDFRFGGIYNGRNRQWGGQSSYMKIHEQH